MSFREYLNEGKMIDVLNDIEKKLKWPWQVESGPITGMDFMVNGQRIRPAKYKLEIDVKDIKAGNDMGNMKKYKKMLPDFLSKQGKKIKLKLDNDTLDGYEYKNFIFVMDTGVSYDVYTKSKLKGVIRK